MFYKIAFGIMRFFFVIVFKFVRIDIPEDIDGSAIICSNHFSMWDPISIALSLDRPVHFMAKKELFENKFVGKILSGLNAFPVDREKQSDMKSIRKAISILKDEEIVGIFPEGTRVKNPDISNMKDGVGFLSAKGNAPIYVFQITSEYKFRSKVEVKFKKCINFDDYEGKTKDKISKITEDIYYAMYE